MSDLIETIHVTVYGPSGKIYGCISCPRGEDQRAYPDQGQIEGKSNGNTDYVDLADPDNPTIADKVSVPHTVTGNLISGLPVDELQVKVSGPITDSFDIPVGDTELTFTADVPGQYTLTLSGVKYLETEVQVAI